MGLEVVKNETAEILDQPPLAQDITFQITCFPMKAYEMRLTICRLVIMWLSTQLADFIGAHDFTYQERELLFSFMKHMRNKV